MMGERNPPALWRVVVALSLILVACGGGSDQPVVGDAHMPQPGEGAPGAFYMTITGGAEDDRLIGAESSGCGEIMIHESVEGDDGMTTMRHLEEGIPVPAGSEVVLEPGGLHLMCIEPTDALTAGASVPLTVAFAETGNIETEAMVEER